MPCNLPDLGAVEADVREGPIIELREFLNSLPVSPPRGEAPDEGSEVHFSHSFQVEGPPIGGTDVGWSVPKITKFNEWIVKDQYFAGITYAILHSWESVGAISSKRRFCCDLVGLNGAATID